MGAMFFCENCGALVNASEKMCPSCGLTFNGVRCPSCGFVGEQGDFRAGCPSCGYLSPPKRGTGTRKASADEEAGTSRKRKGRGFRWAGASSGVRRHSVQSPLLFPVLILVLVSAILLLILWYRSM
jgi:uncharacterized membrane protein YvbJ